MNRMRTALVLSAVMGFISLSQEILWMRAVGFADAGRPFTFAHVLGCFLVGIALGSIASKRLIERGLAPLRFAAGALLASAVTYYASLPLTAWAYTHSEAAGTNVTYLAVTLVALLQGGIFPVLCEYGVEARPDAGVSVSYLYLANILGSTFGPLLTGFVLLDLFTLEQLVVGFSLATLVAGLAVTLLAAGSPKLRLGALAGGAAAAAVMVLASPSAFSHLLEKLHLKTEAAGSPYVVTIQGRSGIIGVTRRADMDIVWGGGAYDGGFCVDPLKNSNGIWRAYAVPLLHPEPKEILEIGLSAGPWARVLADYQGMESLDVVEIDDGYIELIRQEPMVAGILEDPRIKIHLDDGRRWLRRNPDRKFDFILMNTTWHWRSNITNLLSREFMEMCRAHLKPGGVLYFNTTYSDYPVYTAASVFKHMTRYSTFVAVSDSPFLQDRAIRARNLARFVHDGKPTFGDASPELARLTQALIDLDFSDKKPAFMAERTDLEVITDDNMLTEYKLGGPAKTWANLFSRVWAAP